MSTLHEAARELFFSVLLAGELWLDGDTRKWFYPAMADLAPYMAWNKDDCDDSRELRGVYL